MRFTKYISPVLLLIFFSSCSKKFYQVNKSEPYPNTFINENLWPDSAVVQIIQPYKEKLDGEMNRVISYTPIDLPKSGFNSPLANLNCDMIWEETNLIYEQLHNEKVDMCLLNSGGIRRTFTKGDLTVRNVYELMPFENQALVVTLSGEKVLEMVKYLSNAEVGHPVSGIKFIPNDTLSIEINGEKFDKNKTYTVVTNDYLQKGGDQMDFLAKPVKIEILDAKLRDLMMQYFEKHDTIKVNLDQRILK
ncbi:5'-nucleotidase C-terminal domain-containing protein [Moheibacter sediminis]|uniref:5'-nucleotidase, C-terminal domain n=1 Tax=Moheibacter sediminis TaxID=1434700 RepID=A0A1W2AF07_9FLAO|nr:5'-nucleotidase [Moheibacter sediminis]SMC59203.1 5'-nucleotidase, C-terminal domain [Moheibacter sediminis]